MISRQDNYSGNNGNLDDHESIHRFYGKYRGTVADNKDPKNLGRIQANVSGIFNGCPSPWANPCTPYAGKNVGFFFIPPIKAKVWIEFENGDIRTPIWSGCFWDENDNWEGDPDTKMIKTDYATITINDSSSSQAVTIETTNDLKIVLDTSGIELSNGSCTIKLSPVDVSINDDALRVTP